MVYLFQPQPDESLPTTEAVTHGATGVCFHLLLCDVAEARGKEQQAGLMTTGNAGLECCCELRVERSVRSANNTKPPFQQGESLGKPGCSLWYSEEHICAAVLCSRRWMGQDAPTANSGLGDHQ